MLVSIDGHSKVATNILRDDSLKVWDYAVYLTTMGSNRANVGETLNEPAAADHRTQVA